MIIEFEKYERAYGESHNLLKISNLSPATQPDGLWKALNAVADIRELTLLCDRAAIAENICAHAALASSADAPRVLGSVFLVDGRMLRVERARIDEGRTRDVRPNGHAALSLTWCEKSKIGQALAEGVRLAQDRYRLSDLNENADTLEIQRESLGLFHLQWEAVREEVEAVPRGVAYELLKVLMDGDEAFRQAKQRAIAKKAPVPEPPRLSVPAVEWPMTADRIEARLRAAGMAVGVQRPPRCEDDDADVLAHRIALADRQEWLDQERWRGLSSP